LGTDQETQFQSASFWRRFFLCLLWPVLYWTGSKSGLAAHAGDGYSCLLRLPVSKRLKQGFTMAMLVLGLAAFLLKVCWFLSNVVRQAL
jgi:hypothetical protein